MRMGTLARGAAWTLAGLALLVALLLVLLLCINWNDRPPSAATQRLERVLAERPAVADEDNGFVYLLGMSVPRGENPAAWGVRRKAWLEAQTSGSKRPYVLPGPAAQADASSPRTDPCKDAAAACADALQADPAALDARIAENAWRLDRYEALLSRRGWLETIPAEPDMPFPQYQMALNAQRLFLLDTWRRARAGNAAAVRERLDRDARFWRGALASSDLLISKMVAVASLRRNFAFGSLALRELPADRVEAATPPGWATPLSVEERSMLRAMAGEWRWSGNLMRRQADAETRPQFGERLSNPVWKVQDSINRYADFIVSFAEATRAPYAQLGAAMAGTMPTSSFDLYNPVGAVLHSIAPHSYPDYAFRVADLEGVRRSALAAAKLHADGVAPNDAPHALAALPASLRDPYTGKPLQWDPGARAIGFAAQGRSGRPSDMRIPY
ncbi:MAG TPA: hypothetical protein VIG54_08405 [Lysobacter sp.]